MEYCKSLQNSITEYVLQMHDYHIILSVPMKRISKKCGTILIIRTLSIEKIIHAPLSVGRKAQMCKLEQNLWCTHIE